MAFLIHSTADGQPVPVIELPCTAITPKIGMVLYLTSGQLAIAAGATGKSDQKYISMQEKSAAMTAGDPLQVVKATPDIIFEAPRDDSSTTLVPGTNYDVATGGLKIDISSSANGGFVVLDEDAKAEDALCRGYFK